MQTPAVVLILLREYVIRDLDAVLIWYWLIRYIPRNYNTRKEKQRAAILASPVSRRQLELFKKREALIDCIQWGSRNRFLG